MVTETQKPNATHAENPKKTLNDAPPTNPSSTAQPQFDTSAERLPSDSKQPPIRDDAGAHTMKDPGVSKSKGMNGAGAAIPALPANVQKKIKRAERFGVPVLLSEEEKRNCRAERFGTGSGIDTKGSEEQKQKARAERFGLAAQTTADEDSKKKARLERFSPVTKVDPQEEERRKARALRFSQPRTVSNANQKGRVESNIAAAGKAGGEA